jgi:hypothetical protein
MKLKCSVFFLVLSLAQQLSSSINDSPSNVCNTEPITSKIWRIRQLAQSIYDLYTQNSGEIYTTMLEQDIQKFCTDEQVIHNLVKNLKGCSQHKTQYIRNQLATMLHFLKSLQMHNIINTYHPQGYC